jgi:hypothetical protein
MTLRLTIPLLMQIQLNGGTSRGLFLIMALFLTKNYFMNAKKTQNLKYITHAKTILFIRYNYFNNKL